MQFRRLAAAAALLLAFAAPRAEAAEITVFAAASLKETMDAAAALYEKESGDTVRVSYAASSALAKQIEAGAPADLFFSADLAWMDYLAERELIDPATRSSLLGNTLVLVAPKDHVPTLAIALGFDLAGALGADGRLAVGQVTSVPAGKYAKAALEKLGVWGAVSARLAESDNVRAALAFVARGEAPLGIVYATDAAAEPAVAMVGTFPAGSHPAIVYPLALTKSAGPDAKKLLDFLAGPEAAAIFEKAGFTVLAGAG